MKSPIDGCAPYSASPRPAKPISSIAQIEGSGTPPATAASGEAIEPLKAMMPSYTPSRFHGGARYIYAARFQGHTERDYRALRDALNASLARPAARGDGA